jgi:hypothetical protein
VIAGNLRTASLLDVLQMAAASHASGTLQVDARGRQARVYLEEGRVLYASLTPGIHLGEVLVRMDLLSARQVQEVLQAQVEEDAGAPLGYLAVRMGFISDDDLAAALERQVAEVLSDLVSWRQGTFSLTTNDVSRTYVPRGYRVDLERVLMDVVADVAAARDGAITPATVFARSGDPTAVSLPQGAWEVLAVVDGRRSARAIAAEVDLAVHRVFGVLARLEASGILSRVHDAVAEPVVLVATSDRAVDRLLALSIERFGARALTTLPHALVATAEAERPQAIVIHDSGDDGWTAARAVRREGGLAHVPVLVVGRAPSGLAAVFRPARVESLAKPFEEAVLQGWLSQRLGRPLS